MDCAACEVAIAEGLRGLDGVRSVELDWRAGVTRVRYDEGRAGEEILRRRIEELGFTVLAEGEQQAAAQARLVPSALLLLGGFLLLLPLLFVLRGKLVYMPGTNAAFVPGGLDLETFSAASAIAVGVAFAAGIATFFSPSMVALVSVVLGYSAGSVRRDRGQAIRTAAGFALGFIVVDASVGATYGGIGKAAIQFFSGHLATWNLLIAVVLLAVGLLILKVWRLPAIRRGLPTQEVQGIRGAFILSVPFGLIDCPGCNPLLLPIAVGVAAVGSPLFGAAVMGAFGLSRGLLLMAAGASAGTVKQMRGLSRVLPIVETAGGWLLLAAFLVAYPTTAQEPTQVVTLRVEGMT